MNFGLSEFFAYAGVGLFGLLPIANPLLSAVVLLALTSRYSASERNRVINRTTINVMVVIMVCYYTGQLLMDAFGVSIPGLRLAGGMIVAYIGFNMLFPAEVSEIAAQVDMAGQQSGSQASRIAFIPLTIPVTSGPGTIAYVISSSAMVPNTMPLAYEFLMVLAVVLAFAAILWVSLRCATQIRRFLGDAGLDAFSRIMGFVMVCIGMQFCINGIHDILSGWQVIPACPPAPTGG